LNKIAVLIQWTWSHLRRPTPQKTKHTFIQQAVSDGPQGVWNGFSFEGLIVFEISLAEWFSTFFKYLKFLF